MDLPDWLQILHVKGDGETTGEHLARIVRGLDGVSLHHHGEMLAQLFYASEPTEARAKLVSTWKTNCTTIVIAALVLAGVDADAVELLTPQEVGQAVTRLRTYAARRKAVIAGSQWHMLRAGCVMVYWSGEGNDAHVEVCLSDVDGAGIADHGGGGRSDNAITVGRGDVRMSWGRPLQEIYLPEMMVTNEATGSNPY